MSDGPGTEVRTIREMCMDSLASRPLARIGGTLRRLGLDAADLAGGVDATSPSLDRVREVRTALIADADDAPEPPIERVMLLTAALKHVSDIPGLPVPEEVRGAMYDAFRRLIEPEPALADKLTVGHPTFTSACKMLTLRRFPAGEYDWEVSGLPRSLLLRIERRRLPHLFWMLGAHVRGFRPLFTTHVSILRSGHLSPESVNRTYHRMAKSMAMQPGIRGLLAISWMRSPGLGRVSPRLAWLADFIAENGGFVADAGPADPDCGALSRSETRRRLFEEGRYTPMTGIAIWPRGAMLRWASSYDAGGH